VDAAKSRSACSGIAKVLEAHRDAQWHLCEHAGVGDGAFSGGLESGNGVLIVNYSNICSSCSYGASHEDGE